jgi:hypothetical protein
MIIMSDRSRVEQQLVEEIEAVLDCCCTRLGLVGDVAFGAEGLHGMRLVANCLWQAYQAIGTVLPVDSPLPPPSGPQAVRMATIRERLGKIMKDAEVPVVVCYHLDDTGKWNLTFSRNLTLDDAWEILTTFLQAGMDLKVVA